MRTIHALRGDGKIDVSLSKIVVTFPDGAEVHQPVEIDWFRKIVENREGQFLSQVVISFPRGNVVQFSFADNNVCVDRDELMAGL